MGVNHTYRYVDATNVYAKGKADGDKKHTIGVTTMISTNNQIYYGITVDGVTKTDVWYPYDSLTHSKVTVRSLTGV